MIRKAIDANPDCTSIADYVKQAVDAKLISDGFTPIMKKSENKDIQD